MHRLGRPIFIVVIGFLATGLGLARDTRGTLEAIRSVGKQGSGNPTATGAWKDLVKRGPDALLEILRGFDADPIVRNWLRLAAETIAEKAQTEGKSLPVKEIEAFIKDTSNPPEGRRLGYEIILPLDPTLADRLLPGMVQDPSSAMRRDAVARVMTEAEKLLKADKKTEALATYRKALSGACDQDQVDTIAEAMKGLGETVDLSKHFGFVRTWRLIGPFDNTGAALFNTVHPPETLIDLKASYPNKEDPKMPISWQSYTTEDPYGMLDLNRLFEPWKAVTAYAFAEIDSAKDQKIEVRLGSGNGVKVFINGKEIFAHEEYHHGMRVDQYSAPAFLKAGRNELLVKVCQNEKKQPWEKEWQFQVRLCDSVGSAVPFSQPALPSQLKLKAAEQPKKK